MKEFKKIIVSFFLIALMSIGFYAYLIAEEPAKPETAAAPSAAGTAAGAEKAAPSVLIIADFDEEKKPNNVGGDFGSWNYAPNDETQGCWDAFEATDFTGGEGYAIAMEYDVKSPNPAFCGFWMKLGWMDVTPYDILSFWAKGDEVKGYTTRFKIELKNKQGARAVYTVSGIDGKWQEFSIPIKQSRSIKDWSKMDELTVVFDDILATKKVGKIYIDQITFKKAPPQTSIPNTPATPEAVPSKQ
jgi:hypothetical protein